MAARRKPVEQLTITDLGIDPATVGFPGARQEVVSVTAAPAR
jgi:electron transfer flavoprotein beta subunit